MAGFGNGTRPRRVGHAALALLLGTAILAVLERQVRPAVARVAFPTRGAQWIWAPRIERYEGPVSFYAVRDFDLASRPAGGSGAARLLALGDEEYALWLNGQRVGSNRYRPGATLDAYEVGDLLVAGRNRLVAELRSTHGQGGWLAALEISGAQGPRRIVSGPDWRIVWRHHRRLHRPRFPVDRAEEAHAWGHPPTGRWGVPRTGELRPRFREVVSVPPLPSKRRDVRLVDARGGSAEAAGGARRAASAVLFDWGREVTGYLRLKLEDREVPLALLYSGAEPPDPLLQGADAAIAVLPGRGSWHDSVPRRLRYALVVGPEVSAVVRADVLPLQLPEGEALLAAAEGSAGVLGLEPPPLRSPVENEVWRQLEGFPRLARREGL